LGNIILDFEKHFHTDNILCICQILK